MSKSDSEPANLPPPEGAPDLLALLGSRLCHDLVNPIGAVSNGLELLEMTPGDGKEEMALIRGSLDAAMARIRFFRLAFGAGAEDAEIPAREVRATLEAMYAQTRTRILWTDAEARPRSEVRLACLALCCIEVATPWGATVEVLRNEAAWVLHVDAERLRIDQLLWQSLGRGPLPPDLKGAEVQFGILAQLSRRLRRPVSVSADERHLSLIV
ncbi:histidine phosphotransferase family protein [Jannaschia marina]|uniref:histidine phosphotransferase family protein n=1 Tax=Jannaschia marina TaxID=2741674 RepID=UPI0015C78292|nr:histidine phosphotransferase family protein [Jannaschia marina]